MDDLESVLDDSDGHDLLTVVSAVHHETNIKSQSATIPLDPILAKPTHALTSRSTMGIRPLANCFLAYRPAVWAASYLSDWTLTHIRDVLLTDVDSVVNVDVVLERDVLNLDTAVQR